MSDFLAGIVEGVLETLGEFLVEILTGLGGASHGARVPRGSILGLAEPPHPQD